MSKTKEIGLIRIERSIFPFVLKELARAAAIEYAERVVREAIIVFIFESLVLAFEEDKDKDKDKDKENGKHFAQKLCQQYALIILPRHNLRFGNEKPFDIVEFNRTRHSIDLIGTDQGKVPDEGAQLTVVVPPLYDTSTGELVEKGRCYWRHINE